MPREHLEVKILDGDGPRAINVRFDVEMTPVGKGERRSAANIMVLGAGSDCL